MGHVVDLEILLSTITRVKNTSLANNLHISEKNNRTKTSPMNLFNKLHFHGSIVLLIVDLKTQSARYFKVTYI